MFFIETRGNDALFPKKVKFSDAILAPIASFGGIYSPETIPKFSPTFLQDQLNQSYKSLTLSILNLFEIDIDAQTLHEALALYDQFDDATNPVPLVNVGDNVYVSELFHGPTRAFKDMALQPFGYILASLAKQRQQQYLILAATSGDTGPAHEARGLTRNRRMHAHEQRVQHGRATHRLDYLRPSLGGAQRPF